MLRVLLGSVLVLTLAACVGEAVSPGGTVKGLGRGACGQGCDVPAPSARFARLTHGQWENTVQDLLRLGSASGLSASFAGDTRSGFFDTHEGSLQISGSLWSDYQRAAEQLAVRVTTSSGALAPLLAVNLPTEPVAKAKAFIRTFGERAYRRPLTDAEVDQHLALFDRGVELTGVGDPFLAGARIVLQAMLQSPYFLYRAELSRRTGGGGLVALSGYEIASRLSYALWNTMPDDALFAAAASGALQRLEGVSAEANRMLADPRARAVLATFHDQLFDLDQLRAVTRDPAKVPGVTAALGASVAREAELFLDDVAYTRGEGLTSLLLSKHTFVNKELAGLYGLEGTFGADFRRVELPAAERSGLLTRLGFLAAYGHDVESDPIRRGVFVNLRLLCAPLPPPPDNAPPLPAVAGVTTRERVTSHTGAGTCGAGCHSTFINPAGFAFENYDGAGRFRTEDNGRTVDAADQYALLNGELLRYRDAQEFSEGLAAEEQTHQCYAKHWLEFMFGRDSVSTDEPLIEWLAKGSQRGMAVKELILELVTTRSFLNRPAEVTR